MRVIHKTTQKQQAKINYVKVVTGAVAAGVVITFAVVMLTNILSPADDSFAGDRPASSRYPFDLTDAKLQKVNFTILNRDINTIYAEVRPFVAASGKALYFNRRNFPGNVHGEIDRQDIWVSVLNSEGNWDMPVNLGSTVNSKKADAVCGVSPDGLEIVLFNEQLNPDRVLYKTRLTDNGWSEPAPMAITDFYNLHPYVDFYFSYTANVLLMAVGRNDSKGEQDLYVSFPVGKDTWSAPKNLGATVNTSQSDFAPFLAPDGKSLYFASYGHKGFGGCDIFVTTRLDDTWQNWSEPVNLGEGINSNREESYFSISGDYQYIYFESYDEKRQVRDIFRADLPTTIKPSTVASIQ